jgi:hypothetical protein
MKPVWSRIFLQLLTLASIQATCMKQAGGAKINNPESMRTLFEFVEAKERDCWITVNDNVMGGRSKGGFSFKKNKLVFSGATNTDGGGFSSIRIKPTELNLGNTDGVIIRYKADGRTYKFDVRMGQSPIAYRVDFNTEKEAKGWREAKVRFEDLTATWRGIRLPKERQGLEKSKIQSVGFMIYDKKDGPFKLQVDWIKAYSKEN